MQVIWKGETAGGYRCFGPLGSRQADHPTFLEGGVRPRAGGCDRLSDRSGWGTRRVRDVYPVVTHVFGGPFLCALKLCRESMFSEASGQLYTIVSATMMGC